MLAAIRLLLAIVAQESSQDYADMVVADTRMIVDASRNLVEIQKSHRNARARQVVTDREGRALSLASPINGGDSAPYAWAARYAHAENLSRD